MLYSLNASAITEVNNGANAISAMQKNHFDIVLCDYNLGPGKNGLQILEEAKARKYLPYSTVFIMITAEQTPGMVLGAMDNKPDEYLAKPFTTRQLLTRIERNINRKAYLAEVEKEKDKNNIPQAIKLCEKLLQSGDRKMQSQLLKLRAELAINIGDYEHAKLLYEDILKHRQLTWAMLGLGSIHVLQGNFEQAISLLEAVISENPMMMEAYDWLTKAFLANKQSPEAEEILISAIKLSPLAILRQQKLANVAEKTGNIEIATKAYEAAINLGEHSIHKQASDFSGLAKLYNSHYSSQKAQKVINKMRKEFNSNPESELRSAILETSIFDKTEDLESAGQAFERAKALHNQLPNIAKELHLDMAETCYLKNDPELAEQIINRLIKNHIEDDHFIDAIKAMHQGLGKDDHVETLIKKTRQELVEINNKGVNLFKKGQLSEAILLLEQAMEKMPGNKTIILNITKILIQDIRVSGISKNKIARIQKYINQAEKSGADLAKIAVIKQQLNKAIQRQKLDTPHV